MFVSNFTNRSELRVAFLSAAVFCWPVSSAMSTAQADQTASPIRAAFQNQYGNKFDANSLSRYLRRIYSAIDTDRNGLSAEEVLLYQKIQEAGTRARVAVKVLSYDLDGDNIVTRAEIQKIVEMRLFRYKLISFRLYKSRVKKAVAKALAGDPNKDGNLEPSEYGALSKHRNYAPSARYSKTRDHGTVASTLLRLDPNKDGTLTQTEAMELMVAAFQSKKAAFAPKKTLSPDVSCETIKAPKNAQIILIDAYKGNAVPTVTIAGQDNKTSTGKINFDWGRKPIYLVLTSNTPMIWQLDGSTFRLSHVVVMAQASKSNTLMAGVTGVPKSKVHFVSEKNCLSKYYKLNGSKAEKIKAQTKVLAGRNPDKQRAYDTLHELQLPSFRHFKSKRENMAGIVTIIMGNKIMEVSTNKKNPTVKVVQKSTTQKRLVRNLQRHNPGGIIEIDPQTVVSPSKVEKYGILPQESGIIQLVRNGTLEIISSREFRIVKKMRFPAGLGGGHSKKFLLKKGVPEPTGKAGHSCVFSEDKGKYIVGHCR